MIFYKYHGAGNDFILFDNCEVSLNNNHFQALSHRNYGIGADGFLFWTESSLYDFRMIYYNSDGSRAQFCGNGARCLVLHHYYKTGSRKIIFEADDGIHEAYVFSSEKIQISMKKLNLIREKIYYNEDFSSLYIIDSGVLHIVAFVENLSNFNVYKYGKELRFSKLASGGANVNFVEIDQSHHLRIRTYEKGVEGETKACGTGVVATAKAYQLLIGKNIDKVFLSNIDNYNFEVNISNKQNPLLIGSATQVFKGEILNFNI